MMRCVAPIDDDGALCGAPAHVERVVDGVAFPLCAWHAAEFDREPAPRGIRGGDDR
jgi:hypothetical protein